MATNKQSDFIAIVKMLKHRFHQETYFKLKNRGGGGLFSIT